MVFITERFPLSFFLTRKRLLRNSFLDDSLFQKICYFLSASRICWSDSFVLSLEVSPEPGDL